MCVIWERVLLNRRCAVLICKPRAGNSCVLGKWRYWPQLAACYASAVTHQFVPELSARMTFQAHVLWGKKRTNKQKQIMSLCFIIQTLVWSMSTLFIVIVMNCRLGEWMKIIVTIIVILIRALIIGIMLIMLINNSLTVSGWHYIVHSELSSHMKWSF